MITKAQKRRYHLHRKLKKKQIKYSALKRTIYFPHDKIEQDINTVELRDIFHYAIQLEI